ncbi:MAG: branched-chain amino acid transport system II carrier protein [Arsenophonus sp.]
MAHRLRYKNILVLGFTIFSLFMGVGNIIFPPMIGLQSGEKTLIAASGFLITAVGLPIITIITLATVGGRIEQLTAPIGKHAGFLLAVIAHLFVGPLFATPRATAVFYELGITPILGETSFTSLFIYNIIYFSIVIVISLYLDRLINGVGYILAATKMIALFSLGISALLWPAGEPIIFQTSYSDVFFSNVFINGFINGYLTVDALGAMVFGIVIINVARARGIKNSILLSYYTVWGGLIAGILLILIYILLFKLGENSGTLLPDARNGADILKAYVQHTFGNYGSFFLCVLIFIASIITSVGLNSACANFFTPYLPISYNKLVWIFGIFSIFIANLGLSKLIKFSVPILIAIYPPCIILIIMSFILKYWKCSPRLVAPTMLISLLFGLFDVMKHSDVLKKFIPDIAKKLPLYDYNLTWIVPSLIIFIFYSLYYNKT